MYFLVICLGIVRNLVDSVRFCGILDERWRIGGFSVYFYCFVKEAGSYAGKDMDMWKGCG